MILVVGATGLLGSEVCRELIAQHKPLRALVRPGATKAQSLQQQGVEVMFGDLKDSASLAEACRGMRTVVSTASSTLSQRQGDSIESVDRMGQIELVDAARNAGVRQFIFISFNRKPDLECALSNAKAEVEQLLIHSGMQYTILRASFFMEIWLSPALGFDFGRGKATVPGTGKQPVSWISVPDLARFVVACIDNPAAMNRDIQVGGPEALSHHDVIHVFEQASGRTFEVEHIPIETLHAQRAAERDPLQHTFATLTLSAAGGDAIDMRRTLQEIRVPLTSVRDYARRVLGRKGHEEA